MGKMMLDMPARRSEALAITQTGIASEEERAQVVEFFRERGS